MTDCLNLAALGLDWKLAGQRLAKDIRDDFWPDPLGFKDILGPSGLEKALTLVEAYRPRRAISYYVPKANFTIRDSLYLSPLDRLVYQALVDQLIVKIDPLFSPAVFSHRLRGARAKWMFHSGVGQWKVFLKAAKSQLDAEPDSWLVATDVSHYFETVRFRFLRRQLDEILGTPVAQELRPLLDALMRCLSGWSPYRDYGLPQAVDASSFLGNVLLDRVDKLMERDGYPGVRYMDDIRIVVKSEADARKALVQLVGHLREIGLSLNSAKAELVPPGSDRIRKHLPDEDPEIDEIECAIAKKDRQATQGVVELLFCKTHKLISNGMVGERVFRFCLHRIISLRAYRNLDLPEDPDLTDTVLALLLKRPAETDTFCRYLEVAPLTQKHCMEIERLLTDEPLCVYPWQNFQLWRLAAQLPLRTPRLLKRAHSLLGIAGPEASAAAIYLGSCGEYVDRQALKKCISAAAPGFVRRCLQIGIQELNKAERNATYEELAYDDSQMEMLSSHLQSLQRPIYVEKPPQVAIEDLPDSMPSTYA